MLPKIENLNGEQTEELVTALANAFDDYTKMEMMLSYKLDVALPSIVGKDDIPKVSFEVVKHFKTKGKITELIEGAVKQNPTNPLLKAFYEKLLPKTQPENCYFEPSVLIGDIVPEHILDNRAKFFKPFYFERETDAEISTFLAEGKHILVLGNSLAGKTRAVFEALKDLAQKQPKTLVLFPKNKPLDSPIEVPLQEGYHHIAFIEDIDDYYRKERKRNYDRMIKTLMDKGVQIITTCRTGPEYYEYSEYTDGKIRELFSDVYIGKVDLAEVQAQHKTVIEGETANFDGNIGSLFVELKKMEERYRLLQKNTTQEGKMALEILQTLRIFYFTSNFIGKSLYDAQKVIDFCLRKKVGKSVSANYEASNPMQAQLQALHAKQHENEVKAFQIFFGEGLKVLESDQYNLNFLENEIDYFKIEEVYLERIVQYAPNQMKKDLQDLYGARSEQEKHGFFVLIKQHNQQLRDLPTYKEAVNYFNTLPKLGIKPNTDTYTILIEKCDNLNTAQTWYKQLTEDKKLPETPLLLVEMIRKCAQFEQASRYLEKCLALLTIEKDKALYEVLASVVLPMLHTSDHIEQYVYLFANKQARIDVHTFNRMIEHLKEKMDTTRCLVWLSLLRIKPDRRTLFVLMEKSENLDTALKLFNNPAIASIPLDSNIVAHILQKATTLQEGLALLEQERFSKFVDASILSRLLEKATTLQEGLAVLEQARFSKFVDVSILTSLLQKAIGTTDLETLVAKFPDKSLFASQNERFWVGFSSKISLYEDLKNFPMFWENAPRFPVFNFLQKDFKSFEEVYAYAKEHQFKTFRYMHNHLLFVLMTKHLLLNTTQKEQFLGFVWENMPKSLGEEIYQQYKNSYLYPDIQAMLDAYTFPA